MLLMYNGYQNHAWVFYRMVSIVYNVYSISNNAPTVIVLHMLMSGVGL